MTERLTREEGDREHDVLANLRTRYEAMGYRFIVQPTPADLPGSIEGYIPDAVAVRGDDRIAIEVRARADEKYDTIASLAKRFEKRPGWRFTVSFSTDDPLMSGPIPTEQVAAIRADADRVRKMLNDGYEAGALVMAFSLLEATARVTRDGRNTPPLRPGTVVQTLAMEGLVSPEIAASLLELIPRRNRVVHGDARTPVATEDVRLVLEAVETALTVAFAG